MIKKSFFWIFALVLLFTSCQSGTSLEIEKDEYPEIPCFPKITGKKLYLKPIEVDSLNLDSSSLSGAFKSYDDSFINHNDSTFNTYYSIVIAKTKSATFKEGFPQGDVDSPIRMHYYTIAFDGITAKTKIDFTKQLCPKIIRIKHNVYFLYQPKGGKMLQAYQLSVIKDNG